MMNSKTKKALKPMSKTKKQKSFISKRPLFTRIAIGVVVSGIIAVVAVKGLLPSLAASVSTSITPASQTLMSGSNVTVTIATNAGTSHVLTDQLRVTFDATKLQYVSVDYTGSPLDTDAPDAGAGVGFFQISRYTLNTKPTASFTLAKLTFKVLATSGTASLGYDAAKSSVYIQEDNGATDALASVTGSTLTIDGAAPSLTITAPANNATISGSVPFSVTATDDVAVTKVEFSVDGTLKATDTASPYTTSIDATTLGVGNHTFSAVAYDGVGRTTSKSVTTVILDTVLPSLTITAPANNATVSGSVAFSATATDNVAITKVEFSVDGTISSTDTASPYATTLSTTSLTSAVHTLTAKAYDAAGNTRSASVTVTVTNKPGDVNSDGTVTIQDLAVLIANFNSTTATLSQGDLNGDGKVTIQDLAILVSYYGQ